MTQILKPCPFCGSVPLTDTFGKHNEPFVFCPNDECFVQPETGPFDRIEDAVAKWNTRHSDPDELREALEPFAEIASWYDEREDDEFEIWADYPHGFINRDLAKLKHYRKARTALSRNVGDVG